MPDAPRDRRAESRIERRPVHGVLVQVIHDVHGRRRFAGDARPQPRPQRRAPLLRWVRQHLVAEVRDHDDRDDPRRDQRDRRHLENRARVLAGAASRRRDRQEARHRDERAGQHRESGVRVGKARRAHAIEALLHLDRHHLHGDDRVVDEESQRQDQRAERDLVQPDVGPPHHAERDRKHQRNRHRDDQAGTQAEAQERHEQHDDDRLGERADELVHRALHGLRHARDGIDLDPDGELRLDARDLARQVGAELDDVATLRHRHADAQRFLALPAHLLLRRVDVAAVTRARCRPTGIRGRWRGSRCRGSHRASRTRRWGARTRGRWRCRTRPTPTPRSAPRASGRSAPARRRASRAWCSKAR